MEKRNTYIDILIQSLEKKLVVLDKIIEMNIEQKGIWAEAELDTEALDANLQLKGELVDELNLLDEGFEEVYGRVKTELNENRENFKDEIKHMQELISKITEKSVTIKAEEERNRMAAEKKFSLMRNEMRHAKRSKSAATQYYSNMSKVNYVDAQFMDKRK